MKSRRYKLCALPHSVRQTLDTYRSGRSIKVATVVTLMLGEQKKRWQELCALAVKEQDPKKLLALTVEINRLLAAKAERISPEGKPSAESADN